MNFQIEIEIDSSQLQCNYMIQIGFMFSVREADFIA